MLDHWTTEEDWEVGLQNDTGQNVQWCADVMQV